MDKPNKAIQELFDAAAYHGEVLSADSRVLWKYIKHLESEVERLEGKLELVQEYAEIALVASPVTAVRIVGEYLLDNILRPKDT